MEIVVDVFQTDDGVIENERLVVNGHEFGDMEGAEAPLTATVVANLMWKAFQAGKNGEENFSKTWKDHET